MHPEKWLRTTPAGLLVEPGGFYIDPSSPVERAVITHGHSDHARGGHRHVLATPETLAIMKSRIGPEPAGSIQPLGYGEPVEIHGVRVSLAPAGHILGSAQVVLEWQGSRAVVSGDYKRRRDPTCPPFEPVKCDVFITEATFALPVFRHPDDKEEVGRLLHSMKVFPDRTHLVGVYALGKCQRLVREAGYDQPIYLHGALIALCDLYRGFGIDLGDLRPATEAPPGMFAGVLVLAPPSSLGDRWSRRMADPVLSFASGWMRIKQRAKQRGVELPLVISDHADWDELTATLDDVGAPEVWVTHGREDALVHHAKSRGIRARALSLLGFEEEGS
jgi:putative mRNA 3-end processing factor